VVAIGSMWYLYHTVVGIHALCMGKISKTKYATTTAKMIGTSTVSRKNRSKKTNKPKVSVTLIFAFMTFVVFMCIIHLQPSDWTFKDQLLVLTINTEPKETEFLCIDDDPAGRTFNQLLTIAAARTLASEYQLKKGNVVVNVALGPFFSSMYEDFLEPHDNIVLHNQNNCTYIYGAHELFDLFFTDDWSAKVPFITTLIPKASIRYEAEMALASFPMQPVTTVHRRHLEGQCIPNTERPDYIACLDSTNGTRKDSSKLMTVQQLVDTCNLEYNMIRNETLGTGVILCTDRQVPELDNTFPSISNYSFYVEAWMMTKSHVHYGNPMSTIDVVVNFWRSGLQNKINGAEMRPTTCFDG
jgi:hypothetical protein